MSEGICVLKCKYNEKHGFIKCRELYKNGPVVFLINVYGIDPGNHGIHIHRKGNDLEGPSCLCDHYNPTNEVHGGLNTTPSHAGDLGNIYFESYFDENTGKVTGICHSRIISYRLRLENLFGRSIVIHDKEDDLGKGGNDESLRTGNSGERILWGIIGRN